jgi:hypothetical protein
VRHKQVLLELLQRAKHGTDSLGQHYQWKAHNVVVMARVMARVLDPLPTLSTTSHTCQQPATINTSRLSKIKHISTICYHLTTINKLCRMAVC